MMKIHFIIILISYTCKIWSAADADIYVSNVSNTSHPCDSEIYCHGTLLHSVQMLGVFNDSKTFVDMKMKLSPYNTNVEFKKKFGNGSIPIDKDLLTNFVSEYFDKENSEFEKWTPPDWIPNPTFLNSIKDKQLKDWAEKINKKWLDLGRKVKDDVGLHPEFYSLIHLPKPVIVPGGRFREVYYWDSYWIIRGLLLCEMNSTVKGMIINYISMIRTFGYIPNGGRLYYSKRSQPPMIIPMMKSYIESTNDTQFLRENIDALEVELQYWLTKHNVTISKNGKNYTLAVYGDSSTGPRPESYREDIIKGKTLQTESDKENFYSELKAAAESGWDFSTRWFLNNGTNKGNITHVKARSIIPVDLNSLVYWGADILSVFYRDINVTSKADKYNNIRNEWRDAVMAILWDEEVGAWLDFDRINNKNRNYFYPTNIAPLWTGCFYHNKTDYFVSRVINYLNKTEILKQQGGIPTTLEVSDEQWDYPNAWAPLQYIMVMALNNTENEDAQVLASKIAIKWICNNYMAYQDEDHMYEKYLVNATGRPGLSTGEYKMQTGFGWSNGVILEFLQKYGFMASATHWNKTEKKDTTNACIL